MYNTHNSLQEHAGRIRNIAVGWVGTTDLPCETGGLLGNLRHLGWFRVQWPKPASAMTRIRPCSIVSTHFACEDLSGDAVQTLPACQIHFFSSQITALSFSFLKVRLLTAHHLCHFAALDCDCFEQQHAIGSAPAALPTLCLYTGLSLRAHSC